MGVKKSIISYFVILCMCLTGLSCVYAEINLDGQQKQIFSDIEEHWCRDVIEKFIENDWVVGYDDGLFRPDRFINRAEFTAMVVNIFKQAEKSVDLNFSDVKKEDWFYNSIAYASKEKLIQGFEDGTFRPMDNISRQDAAVLAARLFDVNFLEGTDEIKFQDEDEFPEYAYESIKSLASQKVIKGYPDGTFKPSRLVTRAEAVKMLDIVYGYIEIPEEQIPQAPLETPTPSPTETPEEPTPTPKATPRAREGSRRVTPQPVVAGRTYSSTEDFNEGHFYNLSTRVEDTLVLKDIEIENNAISSVYGDIEDSIYIEFETIAGKSYLSSESDEVDVLLKMTGKGDPELLDRVPIDMVIAIDDSGSMEWGNTDNVVESPNRLDFAMEASKSVVNMLQPFDRGAVLGFAGSAWIQQEFTYDKELLMKGIDATPPSPWDGTAIGLALRESIDLLLENAYSDHQKAILLLTDGDDNRWSYSQIIQQAERAKEKDIVVLCVGLGSGTDQELLKDIAEITNGTYSFSPTMEELEEMMYRSGDEVGIFDKAGEDILIQTTLSDDIAENMNVEQEPNNIIENEDASITYQWNHSRLNMGEKNTKSLFFEFENLEDGDLVSLMKDTKFTYVDRDDQLILIEADGIELPVYDSIDSGTWEVVFDSKNSDTKWGNICWNGEVYNDGELNVSVSSSKDNKTYSEPVEVSNYSDFNIPNGRYIKIQVEFRISSDGYSPKLFDISVGSKGYTIEKESNNAPNIELESDISTEIGEPTLLTAKVKGEGNMIFDWEVTEGDADSVNIENKDSFSTEVIFDAGGMYIVTLSASDNDNISISSVEIAVEGEDDTDEN
ncbi:S-layer homology domain-containing protein [Herbivorax sp. ANBcel31]|uniref:S-layer homology domain-containing protein n=1 Tax=Herbivorax sp. ANBcel31 TaxID=3069754 RepID=UPI0027B7C31F|nr:S-layer homology domain-containing protein [Herbivorax sp. ANBcel31]MDQ2087885.1 S-layer homology domain-containing protein [Herbivorax sp. ANBcel31]